MRTVLSWLLPGGAVLLAAVGLSAAASLDLLDANGVALVTERYRLLVFGAGLALALAFHRSRVFIALGGLLLVDTMARDPTSGPEMLFALGLLLVALMGLLAIGRDRGVLSTGGLLQLTGAAALGIIPALVLQRPETAVAVARLSAGSGWLGWLGLPPAVLMIASPALLASGYGVYRWEGAVERSLLLSQILLLIALHPSLAAPYPSLFLMATGLTLTLSVLETSYAMAYRDELTGLPGRRSLIRDLETVGGTYTLAMVDVDHFKKFNDKHGHDVGDQVLRLVAGCLAKTPGGAKAYRYGGEEFTLLFRGRTHEDALHHLEETRAAVEAARFSVRSWNRPKRKPDQGKEKKKKTRGASRAKKLSVTVSIGVADSMSGEGAPDDILKNADKALYRAKKRGRNRVAS